jgi:GNAT superfamily N-acetyltransferase
LIREARASDAPELAELTTQLGYPSTAEEILRRLDGVTGLLAVATDDDDRAVGWIHLVERRTLSNDPFAEIVGLVVDEAHRGRGIGEQLVYHVESWARERGLGVIRVRSNVTRERTHAFYERLGYARVKTSYQFVKKS